MGREQGREKEGEMAADVKLKGGGSQDRGNEREMNKEVGGRERYQWKESTDRNYDGTLHKHACKQRSF